MIALPVSAGRSLLPSFRIGTDGMLYALNAVIGGKMAKCASAHLCVAGVRSLLNQPSAHGANIYQASIGITMQSRKHSALEAVFNVFIGYWVAVLAQIAIFPVFGLYVPFGDNLLMGAFFTVVSLIRSYVLRRLFNRWQHG